MKDLLLRLLALSRREKQMALFSMDFLAIPVLLWLALVLRYESWLPILGGGLLTYALVSFSAVVLMSLTGVYRAVVRAYDEYFLRGLITAVAVLSVGLFILAAFKWVPGLPRSTPFVLGFYAFLWVWGSRAAIRSLVRWLIKVQIPVSRVAIYGAGIAGRQLLAALRSWPEHTPLFFLDDSPELIGTNVSGLPVYSGAVCQEVIHRYDIKEVLVAMPSASRMRRREVIERLEPLAIHVKSLPSVSQLVNGQVSISDVKEVDIADLLGRDPVPPVNDLLSRDISGKTVLVTGAGGSIGSELCRQVLALRPDMLILWEVSEFALYSIEQELKKLACDVPVLPVLGSVLHKERMTRLFREYTVDTIYHAAAYKHVPLVEWNPFEGVINNAIGTLRAAQAAIDAGVPTFVLVSTDKAVRPTNVMGASKRLAELALQAYAAEPKTSTRFCMVRFGNVLGSSGSVVPLFRQQIARGGPITVTHPEVTRYFMTIPEAAQLVIQAGAMGHGGDVFVLDMGDPVRIQDLARKMIHLSGLTVCDASGGDIELEFSGLRPGEKLYEELLIGSNVTGTEHPRIMRAVERHMPLASLLSLIDDLLSAARSDDASLLKALLKEHVDGYVPDMTVMGFSVSGQSSNVVPIKRTL